MRRDPTWVSHRPDVAQARDEASSRRHKQYRCGRCEEEVAKGAMWCPHCGFDMTTGGAIEQVQKIRASHEPLFKDSGRRLLIGTTTGAVIFFLCLMTTFSGFKLELGFGTMALFISMVALASELSIRGVLYAFPTFVSTLTFLSLLK